MVADYKVYNYRSGAEVYLSGLTYVFFEKCIRRPHSVKFLRVFAYPMLIDYPEASKFYNSPVKNLSIFFFFQH